MSIPHFYELRKPTLQQMCDGKIYRTQDLLPILLKTLQLDPQIVEQQYASGNGYIFIDRIGWNLSYLSMAGLITRAKRGSYQINELGRQFAQRSVEEIDHFIKNKIRERNKTAISTTVPNETLTEETTPQSQLDLAYQTIRQAIYDEILDTILSKTPAEFEKLTVHLLQKMGYGNGKVTQLSRDGGIDGIINGDALGLERIYIQAKRYQKEQTIGSKEIQAFVGALVSSGNSIPKGVFITTGRYSRDAIEYIKNISAARVVLIDGTELAKYIYDYDLGMQVEQTFSIKKLDADFWDELQNEKDMG